MKSFKQFLKEGVFSPHNAIVLHRHIVNDITKNPHKVKNGQYSQYANDIHPSLPKDLKINISTITTSKDYASMRQSVGKPPVYHLDFNLNHKNPKNSTPDEILTHLNKRKWKSMFVHEHGHYADWKKASPKKREEMSDHAREYFIYQTILNKNKHLMSKSLKSKREQKADDKYYSHPSEIRSYNHQGAWYARDMKKNNEPDIEKNMGKNIKSLGKFLASKHSEKLKQYLSLLKKQ